MRLKSLSIRNFRSYGEQVRIPFDDFTAIIGKNDVGKSTILEALDIFFNSDSIKVDQSDPCVHSDNQVVEICCIFDCLPDALTIDERSPTTLVQECLLNADGDLEILKCFDCKTKTPKEQVFAHANHPTDRQLADLILLKNADLKARASAVGAELADVDQRSNVALRNAIRATVPEPTNAMSLISLSEEDGKKVWDQLQRELPIFALFQADRPSKDDDPEVADPMKVAVAAAVKEVEADLEAIKQKVHNSVMEVAKRTLAKLREMAPELSNELTPTFKAEPKWDGFKLTLSGDDQIPINKRGSGVRRLILLNFFRAEVERRREQVNSRRVIYAVEEPESSQHPDNQTMLVKALLALSDDPRTQVVITTHVPGVAALIPTSSVRLISRGEPGIAIVSAGGDLVYEEVTKALGVMPDKRAQVAIYVEGPNDVDFLTKASRLYRSIDVTLVDLDTDYRIAFIVTGGGNLKHWVNNHYLKNVGLKEVHVYDADDQAAPKYKAQVDSVNGRGNGDQAFLTQKREMENYIHPVPIAAECGANITFTDWCDVPALFAEQVHSASGSPTAWAALTKEQKDDKISRAKKRLNGAVMDAMTVAQIQQQDAAGEIRSWLEAIRDRVV